MKSFEPLHQNLWTHAQGWQGRGTGDPNITLKRTLETARLAALLDSSPCKSPIFTVHGGIRALVVVIQEALDGKTMLGLKKNVFTKVLYL